MRAECLHHALAGVRDRGWAHHIQRLMVLGNHALQRAYRPGELTEWFATAFVDGFRWVMPTNVIGMSQHADGGLLATKPYASGGAYINKMSDHCGDCAYDPKKRLGDDACPSPPATGRSCTATATCSPGTTAPSARCRRWTD